MQDLPMGISEFTELRQKNRLYVDKTQYVYRLLTKDSKSFLSRPRRFGKSLFVSTLEAALQGKKDLFQGLWIAKSDYHWNSYGVIRLDFSELAASNLSDFKEKFILILLKSAEINHVVIEKTSNIDALFMQLISKLYNVSDEVKRPVALLIDEYDSPILHALHDQKLAQDFRDVIKSFALVAKANQSRIEVVFVTGVSAFSKSGLSSGLNNLENLTMDEEFFSICGYTDAEVDCYFKEHMEAWAEARKVSYREVRESLKTWYNGYCFKENTPTIYSPFSLTSAVKVKELRNFWFESATPQFLLDEFCKEQRQEECKLLELNRLEGSGDLLQTFEIESILLPALLFQMGYLTIDLYDPLSGNYTLKYPNFEVRASLNKHLVSILVNKTITKVNPLIGNLYKFLIKEEVVEVVNCLSEILSRIPYPLHIDEERYYHSLLQTIFFATGIDAQSELPTSAGRMDLILELQKSIYIIELKLNVSAEKGLKQIESQKYYEPFLFKKKNILCLGISFMRKKSSKKEKSAFSITYALKRI